MFYFVKTPWWLKKLYSRYVWDITNGEKAIYLTFDDGPHPEATPFVLDELKKWGAHATFFCVGQNVEAYPQIYDRIIAEGHSVGNHTQHHLNGWKTKDHVYLRDIAEAAQFIDSGLFRPPYGRITGFQARHLAGALRVDAAKVIMWDVLSGDFDPKLSSEKCLEQVILKTKEGSIVVFHDSKKSLKKILDVVPKTLKYFAEKGFSFRSI